jgi:hypothetical protein
MEMKTSAKDEVEQARKVANLKRTRADNRPENGISPLASAVFPDQSFAPDVKGDAG